MSHRDGPLPSVLLVHGAFSDTSSWAGVLIHLAGLGTDIVAVANPLRGLDGDASYVAAIASQVDGPVVLVGHSYAGAVITVAGALAENVVGLVYVSGFALDVDESCVDITSRFPGSQLTAELQPTYYPNGDGAAVELHVRRRSFGEIFGLTEPATTVAAASQRPLSAAALEQRATAAAWRQLRSWYVVTTADRVLTPAAQRHLARRSGAHTSELNAGHSVLLTHPVPVAGIIRAAVKTCRARAHHDPSLEGELS